LQNFNQIKPRSVRKSVIQQNKIENIRFQLLSSINYLVTYDYFKVMPLQKTAKTLRESKVIFNNQDFIHIDKKMQQLLQKYIKTAKQKKTLSFSIEIIAF
jgi:hypothetical protein